MGKSFGRSPRRDEEKSQEDSHGLAEVVVDINRCAKVTKGGRNFSYAALVVTGDKAGMVGVGLGKAGEVPAAIEKAAKDARRSMKRVNLIGDTIPHPVVGRYEATRVVMKPAAPGTGIKAGGSVRAVVESAGVQNILTKCHGSTNPINVVKATLNGLRQLMDRKDIEALRGIRLTMRHPQIARRDVQAAPKAPVARPKPIIRMKNEEAEQPDRPEGETAGSGSQE